MQNSATFANFSYLNLQKASLFGRMSMQRSKELNLLFIIPLK